MFPFNIFQTMMGPLGDMITGPFTKGPLGGTPLGGIGTAVNNLAHHQGGGIPGATKLADKQMLDFTNMLMNMFMSKL